MKNTCLSVNMGIVVQIEKIMGYIVNWGELKSKNGFCRPNKVL